MAKKKKDLKRNEHRRRERKERKERQIAIREAMSELADLLQPAFFTPIRREETESGLDARRAANFATRHS